jgi:hypothetical protein
VSGLGEGCRAYLSPALDACIENASILVQIEVKVLRKLKHPSRSKKLRSFLDNWAFLYFLTNMGLSGRQRRPSPPQIISYHCADRDLRIPSCDLSPRPKFAER